MKKLRVLFLQPQPCIRALKLARGLKEAGGERVNLVFGFLEKTLTELYGYGDEYFDRIERLDKKDLSGSVERLVNEYDPHVIHSHNAPDFLTVVALQNVHDRPIIHDVHDSLTMRNTGYTENDDETVIQNYAADEKIACSDSDGMVYVSRVLRDFIVERYALDEAMDLIFPNYVSRGIIPQELKEKRSSRDGETHIAYAGTITSKIDGHHYDLRNIFREMARNRLHIHIYASREDEAYRRLSEESRFIHYHGHLDQRLLLKELTQYDYGWAGFNGAKNQKHLDAVLPNKAFEYIACGLPILTYPHKTLKEFVEEEKVGLVVEDSELKDKLVFDEELREDLLEKRYDYTIEDNIPDLIDFYEKITDSRSGTNR